MINNFKGQVLTPSDPDFQTAVFGNLWNLLQPDRMPDMIARVEDVDDVIAAVNYARENNIKVTVRGGGHNWCHPSLRNGGLMIDLANLTQVISIDKENKKAVVEPIISNRQMIAYLKPYDLAYPTGHCPTVKLSGYLLGGGMAWNHGVWGPGLGSVEAIELVTANGELVTASKDENTDLYWAARGAGCGLFAVAVRYHLKLYDLPKAICGSSYFYPMSEMIKVAEWLGPLADQLPPNVELSLFVMTAPPFLADQCKDDNGMVAVVTASIFADTLEEAQAANAPLNTYPGIETCLSKTVCEPTDFEALFDLSEAMWPVPMRSKVDALFSNAPLAEVMASVEDLLLETPSPLTVFMYAVFTGGHAPATPADAAFSVTGKLYGGSWTMWDDPADDATNIAWHDEQIKRTAPFICHHYVSESDTTGHPEYLKKAFSPENLARIEELRKQHDPTGVFFGYNDGISS